MKYFNGRDARDKGHWYIAARSQKRAVELAQEAVSPSFTMGELRNYWSPCWGTRAKEVLGERAMEGVWFEMHGAFYEFVGKAS